jgi:hypothetical protein
MSTVYVERCVSCGRAATVQFYGNQCEPCKRSHRVRAASYLAQLTLEQAEERYNHGTLGQIEYESFRRAYAILSPYGDDSPNVAPWLTISWDPAVESLTEEIVLVVRAAQEAAKVRS